MGIYLKGHNKESYNNTIKLFQHHNRVCVEQATSTGKSYVIAKLIESGLFSRVLLLAPSNYILKQFEENFPGLDKSVNKLTYMTYSKTLHLSLPQIQDLDYDLIVLDEYHRLGAKSWGNRVNQILFSLPKAKVFGTTATPIRFMDRGRNMSKELFNNVVANKIDLELALKSNILSKPKYVVGLYDTDKDVQRLNKMIDKSYLVNRNEIKDEMKVLVNNYNKLSGASQILKKHIKDERKFIVFCEDIEKMQKMEKLVSKWIKEAFDIDLNIFEVYTKKPDNLEMLNEFKKADRNKFSLLFSVNMLNEGVHVKDIDGIIMLRNTESVNIYFQQLGRALVTNSNKTPLIFDFVNNSTFISTKEFYFDDDDRESRYKSSGYKLNDFTIEKFKKNFKMFDETIDFFKILDFIEENTSNWDIMFNELVAYKNKYGDFAVPRAMSRLNKWKNRQVSFYKEGRLTPERIKKLEAIDFPWDFLEDQWMNMYLKLIEYKNEFGNVKVLKDKGEHKKLGTWIATQKKLYNIGRLLEYRKNLLIEAGVALEISRKAREDEAWENKFDEFKKYFFSNGHYVIPKSKGYNSLFNWFKNQRTYYNQGTLYEDRVNKFKELGIDLAERPNEYRKRVGK